MTVNIPRRLRLALYVLNVFGTPVVVYALAKGWIGDLELTLWGAEVTAAMTLAGLNVGSGDPNPVVIQPEGDVVVSDLSQQDDGGLIYGDTNHDGG